MSPSTINPDDSKLTATKLAHPHIGKHTPKYPIVRKFVAVTTLLLSSSTIYYFTRSNVLCCLPSILIVTQQWRAQFNNQNRHKRTYIGLARLILFLIVMIVWQDIVFSGVFEIINYASKRRINYHHYVHLFPYIILYVSYVSNTQTMSRHSWRAYILYVLNDIPSLALFTLFKYINWPMNRLSSEIVPHKCYLGCFPTANDITTLAQRDRIAAIVNLCAEYKGAVKQHKRYNIQQLHVPTVDSTSVSYENIVKAVDFMNTMNSQGKAVFVHCKAGIARSATVVCCYLISNGYTPTDALKLMQDKRPEVAASILRYDTIQRYAEYCKHNVSSAPIVIHSWPFTEAARVAYQTLLDTNDVLEAVVAGCTKTEELQCDHTVGSNGSADENGETTLDAIVMCGRTMRVGAVACLREVEPVTQVAYDVMKHTRHSLLVGSLATDFAVKMGYKRTDLHGDFSRKQYQDWLANNKQPNYWLHQSNGQPKIAVSDAQQKLATKYNQTNHDTIGVLALNKDRQMAAACSSNGAAHKIPGRVGDSPICGSGVYVDNEVGAASATGAGDIMLRFCPSFLTVEYMRNGQSPTDACTNTMKRIIHHYPDFQGAVIALDRCGRHGAASYNWSFTYTVHDKHGLKLIDVPSL